MTRTEHELTLLITFAKQKRPSGAGGTEKSGRSVIPEAEARFSKPQVVVSTKRSVAPKIAGCLSPINSRPRGKDGATEQGSGKTDTCVRENR